MSVKYYFIPKKLEQLLKQSVDNWLKSDTAYTTITGVYQKSEVVSETDSSIISKNILKETSVIKNGFIDENGYGMSLIGFCLEADLELLAPVYEQMINSFPEILRFIDSEDYLTWYNQL